MIDHCDIDRYKGDGHRLEFRYIVVNRAGLDAPENAVLVRSLWSRCKNVTSYVTGEWRLSANAITPEMI